MAGLPTFPPECRFSGYYLPLETQYCKYLKVLSDGSGITRKTRVLEIRVPETRVLGIRVPETRQLYRWNHYQKNKTKR